MTLYIFSLRFIGAKDRVENEVDLLNQIYTNLFIKLMILLNFYEYCLRSHVYRLQRKGFWRENKVNLIV